MIARRPRFGGTLVAAAAPLALAASACSLTNPFDPSQIAAPAADCADPGAQTTPSCFAETALSAPQGCVPPAPPALIEERFDEGAGVGMWDPVGEEDPERLFGEGVLDLRCAGEGRPTGIVSQGQASFGPSQPLTLDVVAEFGSCQGCELAVGMGTRPGWGWSEGAAAQGIVGLLVKSTDEGSVEVTCWHYSDDLSPRGRRFPLTDGAVDVTIAVEERGVLRFLVDGASVCDPAQVGEAETDARLFAVRPGCIGGGSVRIRDLRMSTEVGGSPAECGGALRPLLPDALCRKDHIYDAGTFLLETVIHEGREIAVFNSLHKGTGDPHFDIGVASG